jgi:hypothetical protein
MGLVIALTQFTQEDPREAKLPVRPMYPMWVVASGMALPILQAVKRCSEEQGIENAESHVNDAATEALATATLVLIASCGPRS